MFRGRQALADPPKTVHCAECGAPMELTTAMQATLNTATPAMLREVGGFICGECEAIWIFLGAVPFRAPGLEA